VHGLRLGVRIAPDHVTLAVADVTTLVIYFGTTE
jgi:hypothetical protein